jgi:hypothetical protein
MLYTGTPRAAASRFIVPPPLITRSECHIRFSPSTTWSGMTAFLASMRCGHFVRIAGLVLVAGQDDQGVFSHGPEVTHDLSEEPCRPRVVIWASSRGRTVIR